MISHVAFPCFFQAIWNDNGPTASTPLEAFYALKRGLPITVSAGWQAASSSRPNHLTEEEFNSGFPILQATIPGQNLDRRVPSKTDLVVAYDFLNISGSTGGKASDGIEIAVPDQSGNGYTGKVVEEGIMDTPLTSKGLNYTLLLRLQASPSLVQEGDILIGPDDTFGVVQNGQGGFTFAFTSTNITYPLGNYTLPLVAQPPPPTIASGNQSPGAERNHVNERQNKVPNQNFEIIITGSEEGTSAFINGEFVGSFMVAIPAAPMPVHMSFVAPLQAVRYDAPNSGLSVERIAVWDRIHES